MRKCILAFFGFCSALSFAGASVGADYKNSATYKDAYSCAVKSFKEMGNKDSIFGYCIGNSHDPSKIELIAFRDAKKDASGKLHKNGGDAIPQKKCDWLYNGPLGECRDAGEARIEGSCKNFTDNPDPYFEFSRASSSTLSFIKSRENLNKFLSLCRLACVSSKKPDRRTFGEKICGGN